MTEGAEGGPAVATCPPVLDLRGVRRSYTGPPAVDALRGVELRVRAGEYVAIRGPSGAGKSTLLNVIGLLDRPTTGEYLLDGAPTSTLAGPQLDRLRGSRFGFVFQSSHMLLDRTVAANVAMALQIQGVPHRQRPALVRRALDAVGMLPRANARALDLSGGERQRAAIARAIAGSPRILLADEPTGNLDAGNASAVIALMRAISREGITVVVITHDERVAHSADRVVQLNDGRIVS